ncbi:unnamed protein product [Cuscuta campestris]|uniref:Uncharacterized protein n=1 Tax=Cuscuta campestris TaxID=132261 RepID=A0A484KZF6_9ASTE|nr:unnamed protein product [Cuscuta campestris]
MTVEEERNLVSFRVSSRRPTQDNSLKCKHCGEIGQEISGCFQIIGYPEWWADQLCVCKVEPAEVARAVGRPKAGGTTEGGGAPAGRGAGNCTDKTLTDSAGNCTATDSAPFTDSAPISFFEFL